MSKSKVTEIDTRRKARHALRQIALDAVGSTIALAEFRGWARWQIRRELRAKRAWFIEYTCDKMRGAKLAPLSQLSVWYRAFRRVAGVGVRAFTRAEQLALFSVDGEK